MATEFYELSHTIEDGLETYPGLPTPRITDHLPRGRAEDHYAPGASFAITSIDMVANTGTYIDAPFHRYEDGADLAGLSLAATANVPGICVRSEARRIGVDTFEDRELAGKAVLVATGWSRHWGSRPRSAPRDSVPFFRRTTEDPQVHIVSGARFRHR